MGKATDYMLVHASAPLEVDAATGKLKTFGWINQGQGNVEQQGVLTPGSHLAPFDASGPAQEAAFQARYGIPIGSGTGAGEDTTDLTPVYQANGWPLPIDSEDQEDQAMIKGATRWYQALIATYPQPATTQPPIIAPPGPSAPAPQAPQAPDPAATLLAAAAAELAAMSHGPSAAKGQLRTVVIPWLEAHLAD